MTLSYHRWALVARRLTGRFPFWKSNPGTALGRDGSSLTRLLSRRECDLARTSWKNKLLPVAQKERDGYRKGHDLGEHVHGNRKRRGGIGEASQSPDGEDEE